MKRILIWLFVLILGMTIPISGQISDHTAYPPGGYMHIGTAYTNINPFGPSIPQVSDSLRNLMNMNPWYAVHFVYPHSLGGSFPEGRPGWGTLIRDETAGEVRRLAAGGLWQSKPRGDVCPYQFWPMQIGQPLAWALKATCQYTNEYSHYDLCRDKIPFDLSWEQGINNPRWTWGYGHAVAGTQGASLDSTFTRTGDYSVKVSYGPGATNANSKMIYGFAANWNELWYEYYLYIPDNYSHRSGYNDFLVFDGWDIKIRTIEHPDLPGMAKTAPIQIARLGSDRSVISWREVLVGDVDLITPNGPLVPGQWNKVRFYFRLAKKPSSVPAVLKEWWWTQYDPTDSIYDTNAGDPWPSDGRFELYVADQMVIGVDLDYWNNAGPYKTYGYTEGHRYFGNSDSGFAQRTDFYIDDVLLWETPPEWWDKSNWDKLGLTDEEIFGKIYKYWRPCEGG